MKEIKVKNAALVNLRSFPDKRGNLSVAEIEKELPFPVKRIFFIHNVKRKAERACHATRVQQEVLFCLNGSLKAEVDDGVNKKTILLNNPAQGLHIGKYVWRTLSDFSKDCIILALANTKYLKDDHITDYQEFLKEAARKK